MYQFLPLPRRSRAAWGLLLWLTGLVPAWAGVGPQVVQNGRFSLYRNTFTAGTAPVTTTAYPLAANTTDLGAWRSGVPYSQTDVDIATRGQVTVQIDNASFTGTGASGMVQRTYSDYDAPSATNAVTGTTKDNTFLLYRGAAASASIWYQNVSVLPNTQYTVSYFASNAAAPGKTGTAPQLRMQYTLNGGTATTLGTETLAFETTTDIWTKYTYTFTTGASTTNVEMRLLDPQDLTAAGVGTDDKEVAMTNIVVRATTASSGTAFSCDGVFYQIRQTANAAINGYAGNSSQLFRVNRASTPYTTTLLQELGATVNGLSYNPSDGFMYCLTYRGNTSNDATSAANVVTPGFAAQSSTYVEISRIGQGGIESLGFVTGLPVNQWAAGTVDRGNTLYLKSQGTDATVYKLNLSASPVSATTLPLVDANGKATNATFYDMAFDPSTNKLFGVYYPGKDNSTAGVLYNIDPSTGTTTAIGSAANLDTTQPLGSAFFDLAGNLYAYGNGPAAQTATSGKFYSINKTTGVATTLNTINGATNSDGASCINPAQDIDVVKQLVSAVGVAGSPNQRDVTFKIYLRNTGTVTDSHVQVSDFLWGSSTNVTFPTATALAVQSLTVDNTPNSTSLTVNSAFTGQGTAVGASAATDAKLAALLDPAQPQQLTAGQQVLLTFTVRVTFAAGQVPNTVQNNTAYGTDASSTNSGYSQATDGTLVPPQDLTATDASTNGTTYAPLRSSGTVDAASPTPVYLPSALTGTVYEDVNYGGGSGRTLSASSGAVVPSALVELYDGTGKYVASTTTDPNGSYTFLNLTAGGSYTVRVVGGSVTSTRAGASYGTSTFTPTGSTTALTYRTSDQLGVQTYRYNDTERVGGENPAYTDAAANTTGATLASLTSATTKRTAESIVAVTLSSSTASGTTGVDFGYNFDTVVNTNDSGQGSLRQFIVNADALSNAGLAQSGSTVNAAGATVALPTANNEESSIFMISDGKAHAGLAAGLTNLLNASGVAAIAPATALPALASTSSTYGTYTRLDGGTQTLNIGNTNNVTLGAGGPVGTGTATLGQLNGPEVQLTGTSSLATGLDVASTGSNATITGLAIVGFGSQPGIGGTGNVRSAATGVTITGNLIGDPATTFAAPSTTTTAASYNVSNGGEDVRLQYGANNNVVSNNLIGYANGQGVLVSSGVTGVTVQGNEIRANGLTNASYGGIDVQGSSATVTNNLLTANTGQGFDSSLSAGSNTITGNTISGNGGGSASGGVQASVNPAETAGVRIYGSGNSLQQNVIANNYGAGIQLEGTTSTTNGNTTTTYAAVATTLISQNSIYGNGSAASANGGRAASGQVGIDLQADTDYNASTNGGTTTTNVTASGVKPYVTYNNGSGTAGANSLLNYPILQTATVVGSNLHVTGYAKAGAKIELFVAQPNAVTGTQGSLVGNNFGQGKTYLTTVIEGATSGVSDTDASTGQSYGQSGATINGFYQGSDTNANGFAFDIPLSSLPAGTLTNGTLAAGTVLTSTATLSGATSEFSGNVTSTVTQPLTGYVYEDVNYGGGLGRNLTNATGSKGVAGALVELYDGSGNYVASAVTNASGQYTFTVLPGSGYAVRVVDNTVTSTRVGATSTSTTFTPSGSTTALTYKTSAQLAVQTYDGTTNHVGGQNPYGTDAAANTTGATLASLTSGTTLPETVLTGITVAAGSTANAGTDFGFNFDAIVNNKDAGQGSLRQFILNSNALGGETALAPVYTKADGTTTALATGVETSIFMIPNGQAVPGQAAGLTNNFAATATGSAITIAPATALPTISGPLTALDGSTQTRSTGDTNAADYTTVNAETTGPEVLIDLGYRAASGSTAAVAGVNGVSISGNGDKLLYLGVANSVGGNQGVTLTGSAVNTTISNSTINNNDANITFNTYTTSGTAPASAATISGNVIRNSRSSNNDGIELNGGNSNLTISGNYILRNAGNGIDYVQGANLNNRILNNTFVGNGTATGNIQLSGVAIRGPGSNNNVVMGNTFTGNNGAGIVGVGGTTGNVFSQNTYYGNGLKADGTPLKSGGQGLAIDLTSSTDKDASANGDGPTKNDSGDTDAGGNGLLNYPVITSATIVGNTLVVKGYARPGSIIELYNPGPVADPTKFGEGQAYLGTVTEGGTAGATAGGSATALAGTATNLVGDDDNSTGTYGPGLINGLDQGTDNTNKFSFTIPLTGSFAGYAAGSLLSATATALADASATTNSTSEFAGNVPVNAVPVAVDVTNVSVPRNAGATTLSPNLSAIISGTYDAAQYYTLTSLPASGTLTYNGTVLTSSNIAGTQLTPALLSTLKYTPDPAGTAASTSFQYTVTDTNGFTSTTHALANGSSAGSGPATYTIPLNTPPVAASTTNTFVNPGSTKTVAAPAAAFAGTDADGTIASLTITSFPANATSFTVTVGTVSTTYTSANFPTGGLTLTTAANGNLPSGTTLAVDPANPAAPGGSVSVVFSYNVTDNNGAVSSSPGTATLTYTDLTVAGTVYNDVNGTTNNAIDGLATGTPGGTQVYANLVSGTAATGTVLGSVAVNADGTYLLGTGQGVQTSTSFTVVLSTTAGTVGSTIAASTPAGYANTAEGTAAAGDGTPDGRTAVTVAAAPVAGVNFGVEKLAVPSQTTVTAANPGGTSQYAVPGTSFGATDETAGGVTGSATSLTLTTFPTGATTVVINGTSYTATTFASATVAARTLTTNADGSLASGQTLTVDPAANGATQVVVSYVVKDNAGLTSPTATPGTVTLNFGDLSIAGTVYNDVNGLTDNTVNGTGAGTFGSANTQVYVNLVNAGTGKVVAVATVAAGGGYSFGNADGVTAGTSYNLVLSTTAGTVGNAAPAATAPTGYGFTGEGTATGGDGNVNGTIVLGTVTAATSGANFGLELRPTAVVLASQSLGTNPGGTTVVSVPGTYFTGAGTDSDPNVTSPAGAITSLTLTTFPTNTTTVVINGTSYTAATFAAASVAARTLTTNADGSLVSGQTVGLDPNDGGLTATLFYTVTDNGGLTSTTTGKLPVTFTAITLGGTVYNDVDGGTVNGTGQGVYPKGGTQVYVNVVDASGNVVAVATPAANGLFAVGAAGGLVANTTYTLVLSTTAGTVGSPAPAAAAPAGYGFTGESLVTAGTPDGTVDGRLTVSIGSTDNGNNPSVATLRFGLDKLPTAGPATVVSATNPGGTVQYTVPATSFAGTDVDSDVASPAGAITKLTITAFPANATSLVLNGTTYTAAGGNGTTAFPAGGVSVATNSSGNPSSAITVDPVDGATKVVLSYTVTDNAGLASTSASTVTINFLNPADVTTALDGPTQLLAGQPSGTYTVTYANVGQVDASTVTRTVTLPSGATFTQAQLDAITAQGGSVSGTTINFGTVGTLAAGASQAFTFTFTAPTAAGAATVKSTTSTTSNEGANVAPNSSTINATVSTVADVVAGITPISATVTAGQTSNVGFNVTFSNNGALTAAGVTRTVQLQPGLSGVAVTGGGSYDPTTGLVTYSPSPTTIANGTPLTSTITFTAPASGPVAAVASVGTTSSEAGQTANNVKTATIAITPAFDLLTTLSGPASATAGNETMLTVTTSNNGPSPAANAVETVQLVPGLTNVYVSGGGVYNPSTSTQSLTVNGVTYSVAAGAVVFPTIASLPSGQTMANTISFTTPTGTSLSATATVTPNTTATGDTKTSNNSASLTLPINAATTDKANAYTSISAASPTVSAGQAVTLTVVSGNAGPKPAADFTQTVQLLPGLSGSLAISGFTSSYNATTGKLTFSDGSVYDNTSGMLTSPNYGTVASAYSKTTTLTFAAPANGGNNGQLLLSAAVTTSTSEVVMADNFSSTVVTVLPTADVATSVAGPASTVAGQPVTYTASYGNNGPGTATSVTRTAQLPPNLTSVVVTDVATGLVVSGAYNAATGLVTLPTLASEATGTQQAYTIAFAAPGTSFAVSTATATTTPDGTPSNNAATVSTTVSPLADLAVVASGPATAVVGNAVTYFVTTTNNGPDPAASVATTLQLPTGLTGITVSNGGGYDSGSGLVTFTSPGTLASGASVADYVTFTMPNATGGQLSGVATTSTSSTDPLAGNNKSSVATSVAPATTTSADLSTTVAFAATSVAAGTTGVSVTATFSNGGPDAATNVAPTLQLPAGLAGVTVTGGGSYDPTTGLVTWPVVASQASGNTLSYSVSFTAPGSGPVRATSAVASQTSDPNAANNSKTTTLDITATYDAVTSLSGPATSLPGTTSTYTVTATNNGPSPAPSVQQTVTLPSGVTATNISGGGTQSGQTITWPAITGQQPGTAGAVSYTFSVAMPASGSLSLTASVTAAGESNPNNNGATLTTNPANQPPVADNVVNALQSPQGSTANQLFISPLQATDADGTVASYQLTGTLPDATTQGTLYYNNAADGVSGSFVALPIGQPLTAAQAQHLRFDPVTGYAGNVFFSYTATDDKGAVSNTALYTIPVGIDNASTYATTPNKGGSTAYQTGDVLAYVVDANGAQYNASGALYDPNTGKLSTVGSPNNGVTNAVLTPTSGAGGAAAPAGNSTNQLPTGVALNPATGQLYVQDASKLPAITVATTYSVNITTTDVDGGLTTQLVQFTIGGYPLPVELTTFEAKAVRNLDGLLTWTTATERNSDHFDLERSLDGKTFVKIGQVAGQGTKFSETHYTYTDALIGRQVKGQVYYRLRQVDYDGTSAYSGVRVVTFTGNAAAAISLYPNPATRTTTLDLTALPATSAYQVLLLDATGRQVLSFSQAGSLAQGIDLTNLATGTYHVIVTGTQADGSPLRQVLRLTKE